MSSEGPEPDKKIIKFRQDVKYKGTLCIIALIILILLIYYRYQS